MAYKNKTIHNPVTGQHIKFLHTGSDTRGELLEMVSTYAPNSVEPVQHYHPYQSEEFTVISGELTIRMGDTMHILKAGNTLHIPANQVHAMWNNSKEATVVNWRVQPAMNTEHLLETFMGLAADDRTKPDGMPNLLQIALTANRFSDVLRIAKPPRAVQYIVFSILTPFAYLLGYRATYKKYLD